MEGRKFKSYWSKQARRASLLLSSFTLAFLNPQVAAAAAAAAAVYVTLFTSPLSFSPPPFPFPPLPLFSLLSHSFLHIHPSFPCLFIPTISPSHSPAPSRFPFPHSRIPAFSYSPFLLHPLFPSPSFSSHFPRK